MKLTGRLLIIFALLQIAFNQYLDGEKDTLTITMQKYSCEISFNLIKNDTETNLQITSCKQKYCHIQNGWFCELTANKTLNDHECVSECCGNPSYSIFTINTLHTCRQENRQLYLAIFMIVFGAFGLGILLTTCCSRFLVPKCKLYWRKWSIRRQVSLINVQNQVAGPKNSSAEFTEDQFNQKMVWSQNKADPVSLKQKCSICLQSQINSYTSCNHQFHLLCIKKWVEKVQTCPMCKSKNIFPIKLPCSKCGKKETVCDLSQLTGKNTTSQNSLQALFIGKKLICNECVASGVGKQTANQFQD